MSTDFRRLIVCINFMELLRKSTQPPFLRHSHAYNDLIQCIVTGTGNALYPMFSRMTVCGDAWTQESGVNLALNELRLRKYIVQRVIPYRGRGEVCCLRLHCFVR